MSDEALTPENDPDYIAPDVLQIPVYLYEKGLKLPERGRYYVVARDGVYIHMDSRYGSALLKCEGVPWLESGQNDIQLSLPKIPARIIAQALEFFRMVWKEYRAEAEVTLYFSEKNRQYMLWCPTQTVSSASVNYDREDRPALELLQSSGEDYHLVGTIHSHCNFSAFHSGTDTHDEDTEDGIHITLGHVDSNEFSMVASMAVGAGNVVAGEGWATTKKAPTYREQMAPENCALGVRRVENQRVSRSGYMTWGDATYFTLELTPEEQAAVNEDMKLIESEWMPKVTGGGWMGWQKKKGPTLPGGHRAARKATGNH
jgi:PRTRC genetic system protein A